MRKLKVRQQGPNSQKSKKDSFQRPLTNDEKFDGIFHNINQLYKIVNDINNRLVATCRAKLEPEALASFLLDDIENEVYMKNFNSSVDSLLKKRVEKAGEKIATDPALKAFIPQTDEKADQKPNEEGADRKTGVWDAPRQGM